MAKTSQKSGLDVSRQPVGVVYAKALLGAMLKAGKADAVLAEFDSFIVDVLDPFPKLEAILASPRIDHDEKVQVLEHVFLSRMSPEFLIFLKVVSKHGRLDCLRAIHRAARQLNNEMQGRVEVHLTTATALDAKLQEQVTDALRKMLHSEVDLVVRNDKALIGGMVVRVGDTVYDASVANQFARFREEAYDKTAKEFQAALERFTTQEDT